MNLTSGVVFSISVCAIVSFWSGVGAKRAVFPKVFRYFLFCDFCFLSLFCRLSFCHTASVLRLLFPKNAPGFTKRSHFRLQLRNELFTDSGFPKRSCLQLQLRNIFFLALGFSKQSNFQLLLSNRLVLAWFHQAEQFSTLAEESYLSRRPTFNMALSVVAIRCRVRGSGRDCRTRWF